MTELDRTPEFKALQTVLGALQKITPEGRRRIIEAVHALLQVSAGEKSGRGMDGPARKKAAPKKRR